MLVGILDETDGENGAEVVLRLPRAGLVGDWVAVVPRTSIIRDGTTRVVAVGLVGAMLLLVAMAIGLVWATP